MAIVSFGIGYGLDITYFSNKAPVQPIAFSHKIHAGENKIECMHCHSYARKSTSAGVPSVQKCINCHNLVKRDKSEFEQPLELQKVFGYWERQEPIPWKKVYDLPDFVYFPHKRHVRKGVKCQTCHGPVETMNRVTKVSSLKMGWCLSCHRKKEVKNGFDCWTCHK